MGREADGVGGKLYTGNTSKVRCECDSKESGATVCVYEMCWPCIRHWGGGGSCQRWIGREDGVADVGSQGRKDDIVVLKERASDVFECEIAYFFSDGGMLASVAEFGAGRVFAVLCSVESLTEE